MGRKGREHMTDRVLNTYSGQGDSHYIQRELRLKSLGNS